MTSQILFGKGNAEGSWLARWALSTDRCFVCWDEIIEAGEGPAAKLTQGEACFPCAAAENKAKDQCCQKGRLSDHPML